jgi:prophage regulatory protein
MVNEIKILRRPDVERMTGLSRTTIWRLERGGNFPQRVQLSANSVGWRSNEVLAWIEARRPAPAGPLQAQQSGSAAV